MIIWLADVGLFLHGAYLLQIMQYSVYLVVS
jgi:hypothetical protein